MIATMTILLVKHGQKEKPHTKANAYKLVQGGKAHTSGAAFLMSNTSLNGIFRTYYLKIIIMYWMEIFIQK